MTLPDLSFSLPNLSDLTLYPLVSHGPTCTDPPPTPSTCFPDPIVVVRPFAMPTDALGQITQPLSALRSLIPPPPTMGVQCPSLRFDLVAANTGTMTGDSPEVGFLISRPEGDACLPLLLPQIIFPCTSITATAPGLVSMVNGASLAGVVHDLATNDTDTACSTNMQVNVAVPCVVATFSPARWDDIQASPEGSLHAAATTAYVIDTAAYSAADAVYNASHALYLAEYTTYTTNRAAYIAAYSTWQAAMVTWRLAMQQQPQPMPLPAKPAKPVAPVAPVAPVGPPPVPAAPVLASAAIKTTASPISKVITAIGPLMTDISVNCDPTGFSNGDLIQIGTERMLVAAITSMALTVQRAAVGTSLETHGVGDLITVCQPTGGTVQVLISGPPCERILSLGLNVRMPSSVSGGGSAGSSGGGGFVVGTAIPAASPFASSAYASTTTYPPGGVVPIVDAQGITTAPGTQIDPSVNYVINNTSRTLAQGDVVSAWATGVSPPTGYTASWSVV